MTHTLSKLAFALAASAMLAAPVVADARPGGGGGGGYGSIGGNGGGGGGGRGGWNGGGGYGGHGYGGGWNHGGWGPGYFWGGLGFGLGLGALAYGSPYYGGYGGYGYYGGYYPYAGYVRYDSDVPVDGGYVYGVAAPTAQYVTVDPTRDPRVPRTGGQPVPAASRAPDPIFYPRNGQTAAQTETDRQDCNRWAASQPSALNDGSVFQRATFACMDGRGYTVR